MELDPPREAILDTLAAGEIAVSGQFRWGSNHTYLVEVAASPHRVRAVYKPAKGEQPLWDFPAQSLARREVAAYAVSAALGWELVPPTVYRPDGPGGGGSLQLFQPTDPARHYFTFSPEERQRLRPAAAFDVLINNADRKGGHVLLASDGHLWLIDHGVCFHPEYKLRTVIWDFAGEPIPASLLEAVDRLKPGLEVSGLLRAQLSTLLSEAEVEAIRTRVAQLLGEGRFPYPEPGRPYPWPLV